MYAASIDGERRSRVGKLPRVLLNNTSEAPHPTDFLQQLEILVESQQGEPYRDVYDFCNRFSHREGSESIDVLDARAVHGQIQFRRWLNSAIQNSRGVTFLLQKQKARWADFDLWHGSRQDEARKNPVLGWGVTARNRIVKEGDHATLSQVIIGVYDTHRRGYEDVSAVPPSTPQEAIIAAFLQVAERDGKERKGWIRVERRWVDDQLPDYELVVALREMYRAVAKVVRLAHKASGVETGLAASFARECVTSEIDPDLRCLGSGNPAPTIMLDLESGEVATTRYGRMERDDSEDLAKFGREHYGEPPKFSTDPIAHVDERMELSRQFLKADGYAGRVR